VIDESFSEVSDAVPADLPAFVPAPMQTGDSSKIEQKSTAEFSEYETGRLLRLAKQREGNNEALAQEQQAPPGSITVTDYALRKLRDEFANLRDSEEPFRSSSHLRAFPTYTNSSDPLGAWTVSDGATLELRSRFEDLASRAGRAIGCPPGIDPIRFFLHHLYQDLLRVEGPHCEFRAPRSPEVRTELHGSSDENAGLILRLLTSSVSYLTRLATVRGETKPKIRA
jgi:hypothetical protein